VTAITDTGDSQVENVGVFSRLPEEHLHRGMQHPSGGELNHSSSTESFFMGVNVKRIGILACILAVCFVSTVWGQVLGPKSHLGRRVQQGMANRTSTTPSVTSRRFNTQTNPSKEATIWELGTYPGGTWAGLGGINDFGVAIGFGDVPPIGDDGVGYTHTLAVSLFGPHAGEWIDLGTLGGELSRGWEEPYWFGIADTGLIVTHSVMPDGQVHAAAWTAQSGLFDLGTLADTGNPKYRGYNSSYASATNRSGTLIVGWSGLNGGEDTPVVWTASWAWNNGRPINKWHIHALDTRGFPKLEWQPGAVNDYGQIMGFALDTEETFAIPLLWNRSPDGQSWKLMVLPYIDNSEYPYVLPFGIDRKGNITGAINSADGSSWLARLWKPLNVSRTRYSLPIELPIPDGYAGCEAVAINELGDITGDCYNDVTDLPARWALHNLTFSEIINIPGDWGLSIAINNNRITVLTYGGSLACPSDTFGSCGGAIQIH